MGVSYSKERPISVCSSKVGEYSAYLSLFAQEPRLLNDLLQHGRPFRRLGDEGEELRGLALQILLSVYARLE